MQLLTNRRDRKFIFGALYFSEGAPIGFIWWALPTIFRAADIPIQKISTLVAVLVLPWAFKFLWAPIIDTLRSPRWTLRGWILLAQFGMGLTLLPLFFLDLHDDFRLVTVCLVLHACMAATQDVAIDALCISVTPERERGGVNGWMQTGMLGGRSIFGGGALIVSAHLGLDFVLVFLIAAIWCSSLLLILSDYRESAGETGNTAEQLRRFARLIRTAAKHRSTWRGFLFALVGGAGFEAVGSVAGPFLIDRGFSTGEIGWFFALPTVLCMVGGALLGGYASDRIGRRSTVAVFLLFYVAVIFLIAGADVVTGGESGKMLLVLLAVLYFGIGLFTSSSYALFMDITDVRLGATQFSAFMGATNMCESWSAFSVGRIIGLFGYPAAFAVMALFPLLTIPLIRGMQSTDSTGDTGSST